MDIDFCQKYLNTSKGDKNPYTTLTVNQFNKLFFKGILAFSLDYVNVYTGGYTSALHFSLGLSNKPCLKAFKTLN